MTYLLIALIIAFLFLIVSYILDCRKTTKIQNRINALDKEIEQVNRATDKLFLDAYRKVISKGK